MEYEDDTEGHMEIFDTEHDEGGSILFQTGVDPNGDIGLVIGTAAGTEHSYCMDTQTVERLITMLNKVLQSVL